MSIDRAMTRAIKVLMSTEITIPVLSAKSGLSTTELKNALSNKVPWQMKRVAAVARAFDMNTWQLVKLAESIYKNEG